MSLENIRRDIEFNIKAHGRAVLFVGENPAFSYTIGNHRHGFPELLLIGVEPGIAKQLLNGWSEVMWARQSWFEDGEVFRFTPELMPTMAVVCPDEVKERYTRLATGILGTTGYSVIQMVLSDRNGRFPGDPLCEAPYSNAVVLRKKLS